MGSNPRAYIPDNVLAKIAGCNNGTMLFKPDGWTPLLTVNQEKRAFIMNQIMKLRYLGNLNEVRILKLKVIRLNEETGLLGLWAPTNG